MSWVCPWNQRAGTASALSGPVVRRDIDLGPGPRQPDGCAHLAAVRLGLHVVEQYLGMLAWIGRAQLHIAAAGRAHRPDMGLIAMPLGLLAAVVGGRDGQEVILQVGMLDPRMTAD